jgi:nicotinamide-nucleotide amidase
MGLNIAVLTTGDELINGEMADTNTLQIARFLGEKGYAIRESRSVGDLEEERPGRPPGLSAAGWP